MLFLTRSRCSRRNGHLLLRYSRTAFQLRNTLGTFLEQIKSRQRIVPGTLAGVYLAAVCARACRPVWHGEFYTDCTTRSPNLAQLQEAIRQMDLNLPLLHGAIWMSHLLLGPTETAAATH